MEQPRKIRRPAVACTECRRRKVKCDRRHPCQQCQQAFLQCYYAPRRTLSSANNTSSFQRPLSSSSASNVPHIGHRHTPSDGVQEQYDNSDAFRYAYPGLYNTFPPLSWPDLEQPLSGSTMMNAPPLPTPMTDLSPNLEGYTFPNQSKMPDNRMTVTNSSFESADSLVLNQGCIESKQHWKVVLNQLAKVSHVNSILDESSDSTNTAIRDLQRKCAQRISSQDRSRRELLYRTPSRQAWTERPPRPLCDELVNLYLYTFDKIFRVFHVPTFIEQYRSFWQNPATAANDTFHRDTLSLVFAIGASLHPDFQAPQSQLRSFALKSILEAHTRLNSFHEDANTNITTVQTHCLLLIARQTSAPELANALSTSSEALLRAAMKVGLHRTQSQGGDQKSADGQLRKKLWITTLELSIQSSLDSGLPLSYIPSDLRFDLPEDVDDASITGGSNPSPRSQSSQSKLTDQTIQLLLAKAIPTRVKILQYLNGFDSDHTYAQTLQLSRQLEEEYRAIFKTLRSLYPASNPPSEASRFSAFYLRVVNDLVLGFAMTLHGPFAIVARDDPTYYFSRKKSFEAAWLLEGPHDKQVSNTSLPIPQSQDLYQRLRSHASGMFSRVHAQAMAIVCLEMLYSFDEESFLSSRLFDREVVFTTIQNAIDQCAKRIDQCSGDVSHHVIFSCALAHVRALESSESPRQWVAESAHNSLNICLANLQRDSTDRSAMGSEDGRSTSDSGQGQRNHGFEDLPPSFDFLDVLSAGEAAGFVDGQGVGFNDMIMHTDPLSHTDFVM